MRMRKRRRMRQTCSARGNRCRGKSTGVKAVWQREEQEMQRQVNRLQGELLAAANAKASLEEMRKRREEDQTLWQRERKEMQRQDGKGMTQGENHG